MIKINLSSHGAGSSAASAASFGGGGGDMFMAADEVRKEALKRVLIILIFPVALYAYQEQNIPGKQAELSSKQQMLTELQSYNEKQAASVAEIKKFKEDEAIIEARITALDKISKDRNREVRVLDLLQTVIPEKAWLTKIQLNPDKVVIQGLAVSDFEVSQFLDSLTKSVFLMDVNLVSSSEVILEGVTLKKFEVSCVLERL